jgi:hypothetical protein
MPLHLPD